MTSSKPQDPVARAAREGQSILLSDAPAEADAFGGHARVAGALAELIETDDGGRTIGLEGGWGTGKSTVVRLLSDALSKDTRVFTFDAWAHEDDPLRRSFLEALIDFVKSHGWLSREDAWAEEADRLARRRRETEQHSDQHLTSNGRWITGSLFFVPVGSATLNWALGQSRVNPLEVALGALITLTPLLVIGWLLLRSRRPASSNEASNSEQHREHPLSILGESSTTHQKSLTIEDNDPTSVEFERVFQRLLSDVLEDESRRLVIVLDNLDRVGAETSARVMATLQTFIGLGARLPESKRMWVLLPYDRNGFQKLWGDATNQQLDKICQARFYVPPVLTADWRAHLKHRLRQAMPSRLQSEVDESVGIAIATQVDGLWPTGANDGVSPSPRDMVLLANDVAALDLQRPDVGLKHLIYYAILRRQRETDLGASLASGDVPTPRISSVLGPEGPDNLAALHFNVRVDESKQILLAEPASLALRRGDPEGLRELARYPGFWDILQTLPYGEWTSEGGNDFGLAGSALELSALLEEMPTPVAESVGTAMKARDGVWGPLTYEAGRGLAALVRQPAIDVDSVAVLSNFDLLGGESGAQNIEQRVRALLGFVEVLGPEGSEAGSVYVEGAAEVFVEICAVVGRVDKSKALWQMLKSSSSPKDIAAVVAGWAGEAPDQTRSLDTLEVLLASAALPGKPKQVVMPFITYIQGAAADASAPNLLCIEVLFRLGPDATDSVRSIVDDGTLLDMFYGLQTAEQWERAAEAAVLHLGVLPNLPEPPAKGNSAAGAAMLRELLKGEGPTPLQEALKIILEAHGADIAYTIGRSVTDLNPAVDLNPAIADAIRTVLRDVGASPDRLIRDWKIIGQLVARDELVPLVEMNKRELAARIESANDLPRELELILLEISLDQPGDDPAPSVRAALRIRLESMSQEEWTAALSDGGHAVDLLSVLLNGDESPSLAAEFQEALIGLGESIIGGESPPVDERYRRLHESLAEDHHRRAVASKVAEFVIRSGQDLPPTMLTVFGTLLQTSAALLEHPELMSGLVADSVRARNAPAMAWCAEILGGTAGPIERSPDDSENVKDLIRAAAEDGALGPELLNLATAMGVELAEADESSDE